MKLEVIDGAFSICRVPDFSEVRWDVPYTFTAATDTERSLVCPVSAVPPRTLAREDGWRMLRVAGTLDFSLTGILSRLAGALAACGVAVFAVSTFGTDYLLARQAQFARALAALEQDGHTVIRL